MIKWITNHKLLTFAVLCVLVAVIGYMLGMFTGSPASTPKQTQTTIQKNEATKTTAGTSTEKTNPDQAKPTGDKLGKTDHWYTNPMWWVGIGFSLLFLALIIAALRAVSVAKRESLARSNLGSAQAPPHPNQSREGSRARFWEKGTPVPFILLGLVVLNLVIWKLIPWMWKIIHQNWYTWLIFNVGLGAVLYLNTVKTKDAAGKETKETNPTAARLAKFITVLLVLGFVTAAWGVVPKLIENYSNNRQRRTVVRNDLSHGAPWVIAKPLLADAETGGCVPGKGHQFADEAKKIPVRNPADGKPGTGAVGKFQLNLSDPDVVAELKSLEEEMKKDGRLKKSEKLDVEGNEAHNEAAAEYLYNKRGTAPWTASKSCWEPKLRAYTWGGRETVAFVVVAPVNDWSPVIPLPRNGDLQGQHSLDGYGKQYIVRWNVGRSDEAEEDMPRASGQPKLKPAIVYDFCLKSRETAPAPITVKFF